MASEIVYTEIRAQVDRGELRKSAIWGAVESAARKGDSEAAFTLAHRYYRLRGKHYEKTRWWMVRAAELGHPQASQLLAEIDGESLEERKRLISAAESGDLEAQVRLGHILGDNWDGIGLDLEQSRHWFQQASLQGNQSAQYHLGLMFLRGEGGPTDAERGVHWLEQAAFGDVYSGAEVLAAFYEAGSHGLPTDLERAAYWRAKLLESQALRYFKYFWDEDPGEELAGWGSSWWYSEVDSKGYVSRVLQSYGCGRVLRYDEQFLDDEFGGLPDGCVDVTDTGSARFQGTSFSRPGTTCHRSTAPGRDRPVSHRAAPGDPGRNLSKQLCSCVVKRRRG